jgi:pyruvate/2-oxoglutarate dehydrogenase complex dihydrolipoamide dehydrogenase (E3) component
MNAKLLVFPQAQKIPENEQPPDRSVDGHCGLAQSAQQRFAINPFFNQTQRPTIAVSASCTNRSRSLFDRLRWRQSAPNEETTRAINHLFLFIGAEPNTDWLAQCDVALDEKGFVRTGEVGGEKRHALETSRSGVFAIGDVRWGSVKRVAVGEGAQVVSALHAYLARSGSAATFAAKIASA